MVVPTSQCYKDCVGGDYPHRGLYPGWGWLHFVTPQRDSEVCSDHEWNIGYHVAYLLEENQGGEGAFLAVILQGEFAEAPASADRPAPCDCRQDK